MTAQIILEPGSSHLSVKLLLNLQTYCDAYQLACEGNGMELFKQERAGLFDELSGLQGDLHWDTIKKLLSEQCDLVDPFEKELFMFLMHPDDNKECVQLALVTLNDCFIELLKNSIDAMLKCYLHKVGNAKLEMVIRLSLEADQLIMEIMDNAGGFSAQQLERFNLNIRLKNYAFHENGFEKKHQKFGYFMGGAGLGMAKLSHALMDGQQELKPGLFKKNQAILPGSTLIKFDNVPIQHSQIEPSLTAKDYGPLDYGAKITLISPRVSYILQPVVAKEKNSLCLNSPSTRKRKAESSKMLRDQRSVFQVPIITKCRRLDEPGEQTRITDSSLLVSSRN